MTMGVSRATHIGNKKESKKHWKNTENVIIKQKHIIN